MALFESEWVKTCAHPEGKQIKRYYFHKLLILSIIPCKYIRPTVKKQESYLNTDVTHRIRK